MAGYTKLFSRILDSTIWREPDETRLLWITMLALADQDGVVHCTIPGLADRARISLNQCEIALDKFQQPDKYSWSKDMEGRRITVVDGGWFLVNHSKYRALMCREEQQEKTRLRVQKHRAARKHAALTALQALPSVTGNSVTQCNDKHIAEAEADAEAKKVNNNTPNGALKNWLAIKESLREQMSDSEFNTWVRPIYLLKVAGNALMLTVPPSNAVMSKAKGSAELQIAVKAYGYSGAVLMVYPDQYELDALRERYPAQFEELQPALKKRVGRA